MAWPKALQRPAGSRRTRTRSTHAYRLFPFFFLNDPAPTEIPPFSLPDPLPIYSGIPWLPVAVLRKKNGALFTAPQVPPQAEFPLHHLAFQSFPDIRHPSSPLQVCLKRKNYCRSEEHTSELQSPCNLVCRLLLEK